MAKNYRRFKPTGYKKKRSFTKRKAVYTMAPLYRTGGFISPLPPCFKAAVTWRYETELTMDNSHRVVAATIRAFEPCRINITTPANSIIAGHIVGLMSIYSKCSILRSSCKYQFQSLASGLNSQLELASGVLSYQDGLNYPFNDGSTMDQTDFDRLRTVLGSRYHTFGDITGGAPSASGLLMTDLRKFIGQPLDSKQCCYSALTTDNNILYTPNVSDTNVVGTLPVFVFCFRQNTDATADVKFRMSVDVTNYCEFSSFRMHPQQVQFTKPWLVESQS